MMITYRFVRLIEDHSDALASGLLHNVQQSTHTEAYRQVPSDELKQRVYEIYRHLYAEIGARRAQQGVPLSQLIWAIVLTKHNLWEFILDESYPDRPVEILGKQELLQLLDQFFDRSLHAAAVAMSGQWKRIREKKTVHGEPDS
jgi:hypothetical protein